MGPSPYYSGHRFGLAFSAGGVEGPRSTSQARGAGKAIIEFRGTSPSPAGESGKRNYTNPGTASPQCKSRTERVLGLEKSHSIGKKTN